jgi:two-component system sensor histidine kinase AtoS
MPHFFISRNDRVRMEKTCYELFRRFDIDIDITVPVGKLTEAEQQIVEIARVLSFDHDIIILDEISNRRKPAELSRIFKILKNCKDKGKSIIYITSNIDEIFQLADRVTVLKNGYRRGTELVQDMDRVRLINLAFTFALNIEPKKSEPPNPPLLRHFNDEVIKGLPTGVIIFDHQDRIILYNVSASRFLSLKEDTITGLSLDELFSRLGLEGREEIAEEIRKRERSSWERINFGVKKVMRLKVLPITEEDGSFSGTIMFIEDVSMDHFVKEYLMRAEQVESIAELAAGVAHEINNPLGIIQNYVELMKMDGEGKDRESITMIEKELSRIVEIVSSLLSFSRVNQLPKKKINPALLIDEVLLLLSHKLRDKRIKIVKNYETGDALISGIENKLKQLFINIITNAYEAVLDNGTIEIRVREEKRSGYVEISITDNGYGIPREIQNEIFSPFFSTKMTKTNTGLGLAICQHIVEIHNGVITFESTPGEKTSFTVKLPV